MHSLLSFFECLTFLLIFNAVLTNLVTFHDLTVCIDLNLDMQNLKKQKNKPLLRRSMSRVSSAQLCVITPEQYDYL